jgi:hypothetical protein
MFVAVGDFFEFSNNLLKFRLDNNCERLSETAGDCQKMSLLFSCGIIENRQTEFTLLRSNLFLKVIIALTFGLWILFFLLGKGGFIHIFLLVSVGTSVVEILRIYRRRLTENAGRTN